MTLIPCSSRVSEEEKNRLIAWNRELTAAHQRLRQALRVTRDGLSAIMESHFNYEERELLGILSALHLAADPQALLGPL
jgi:hypothetical protein